MRYVSIGEYCVMYFGLNQNLPVVKPYLRNMYQEHMECKLYALSKYDRSYGANEYLVNMMYVYFY